MKRLIYFFKRISSNKKVFVLTVLFLFAIVFSIVHLSYALFSVRTEKGGAFTFTVGELPYQLESLSLDESKSLTIGAGERKTIELTVTNLSDIASHFKLYYSSGTNEVSVFYFKNENYVDGIGTLASKGKSHFLIVLENHSSAKLVITLGVQGGLLNRELTLEQGKELTETLEYMDKSGANRPVLVEGQIPVVYDQNRSSWVKADTKEKWYDYNNQEWANVVTVKENGTKTRGEYMNATPGTVISMDDINTMWVWIPRYKYSIPDEAKGEKTTCAFPDNPSYSYDCYLDPGEIQIQFVLDDSVLVGDSTSSMIHPAFTFGEKELEGIWYAKFETTGTLSNACTNENCDVSSVTVKPFVASLRNQRVSSFFYMARSMQMNHASASTFGFSKTDSDLHMSKNSEWGAVAYLSQSKYGKFGNNDYAGREKEVYQNKSTDLITGSSNGTPSTSTYHTQVAYDVERSGTGASTTGNITGVYDMSGGSIEYVMGVLADPNGLPRTGFSESVHSGFNGMLTDGSYYTTGIDFPDPKYYDLYQYQTTGIVDAYHPSLLLSLCNHGVCFGHALSETNGWYQDSPYVLYDAGVWYIRGGATGDSEISGIFSTGTYGQGEKTTFNTTRLVHVPL